LQPFPPVRKLTAKSITKLVMWLPNISGYSYVMQCMSTSEDAVSANFQSQTKKWAVRGHRETMGTPHYKGQHMLGLVTKQLIERICPTEKASPQSTI
jgi:hypothetical protein